MYLNTVPFVAVKAFHSSIMFSTVSSHFGTTRGFVLFTAFNKLAEFWLETQIAKATAIINHDSLAKGIILIISASFNILQGANTVRMSYSSTMRVPPAVIATVVVDTIKSMTFKMCPWTIRPAIFHNYSNLRKCP